MDYWQCFRIKISLHDRYTRTHLEAQDKFNVYDNNIHFNVLRVSLTDSVPINTYKVIFISPL